MHSTAGQGAAGSGAMQRPAGKVPGHGGATGAAASARFGPMVAGCN